MVHIPYVVRCLFSIFIQCKNCEIGMFWDCDGFVNQHIHTRRVQNGIGKKNVKSWWNHFVILVIQTYTSYWRLLAKIKNKKFTTFEFCIWNFQAQFSWNSHSETVCEYAACIQWNSFMSKFYKLLQTFSVYLFQNSYHPDTKLVCIERIMFSSICSVNDTLDEFNSTPFFCCCWKLCKSQHKFRLEWLCWYINRIKIACVHEGKISCRQILIVHLKFLKWNAIPVENKTKKRTRK